MTTRAPLILDQREPAGAACSREMVAYAADALDSAKHELLTKQAENYESYVAMFTRVRVLAVVHDQMVRAHRKHFHQ